MPQTAAINQTATSTLNFHDPIDFTQTVVAFVGADKLHAATTKFYEDQFSQVNSSCTPARKDPLPKPSVLECVKNGAKRGVYAGDAAGSVITFIPDVILCGDGAALFDKDLKLDADHLESHGLLGSGLKSIAPFVPMLGAVIGGFLGAVAGIVSIPVALHKDVPVKEWISHAVDKGFCVGSCVTAPISGGAFGLVINIIRLPTTLFRLAFSGLGGAIGAVAGFFYGLRKKFSKS